MFNLTVDDRITRAKVNVLRHSPFFSYLVSHLKFQKSRGETETCGVDKRGTFYYNENFIGRLKETEMSAVFIHEVLHLAFEHPKRGKNKTLFVNGVSLWNIATDIVVNNIIVKNGDGWAELPKDGIIPEGDKIDIFGVTIENISNKSADEIYWELAEKLKQQYGEPQTIQMPSQGDGEGNEGDNGEEGKDKTGEKGKGEKEKEGEGQGDKEKNKGSKEGERGQGKSQSKNMKKVKGWQIGQGNVKRFDEHKWDDKDDGEDKGQGKSERGVTGKDWKKILSEAYNYAKQRGEEPLGMEREIEKIKRGKINWRAVIRQTVKSQIPADFTWIKPNRKYIGQGVYLPAVKREGIEVIVTADTSGSMTQEDLETIISETISMARSLSVVNMRFITHDAEVQDDYEIRNGNVAKIRKLKMHGGGGTSHIPLFRYIDEKYPRAKLVISFTDGYSAFPEKPPRARVVFVLTGTHVPTTQMPKWAMKVIEYDE